MDYDSAFSSMAKAIINADFDGAKELYDAVIDFAKSEGAGIGIQSLSKTIDSQLPQVQSDDP